MRQKRFSATRIMCLGLLCFSVFAPLKHKKEVTHAETRSLVDFTVVVLAMNRTNVLSDLLSSLDRTDFVGDLVRLCIHFDKGENQAETVKLAKQFRFRHGKKHVVVSNTSGGLAASWYDAWYPTNDHQRAIILEDDILLSTEWYKWLKESWKLYGHVEGLAGISLQRQTLVPYPTFTQREIVNAHDPFLYPLVGSIGFSPQPQIWRSFVTWIRTVGGNAFDASTPGLVTSEWWNTLDKRQMWTQHYIHFCLTRGYYTLYVNLRRKKTLAAHVRAKGAHYSSSQGADFQVAGKFMHKFPRALSMYDWDGQLIGHFPTDTVPTNSAASFLTVEACLHSARKIQEKKGFVPVCHVTTSLVNYLFTQRESIPKVFSPTDVVFVSTKYSLTRALTGMFPGVTSCTLPIRYSESECRAFDTQCRDSLDQQGLHEILSQGEVSPVFNNWSIPLSQQLAV